MITNKNSLIIGADGHGRCCLDIARSMQQFGEISFIDDNRSNTVINHDVIIENYRLIYSYTLVKPEAFIASYVKIGNHCLIDSHVCIKASSIIEDVKVITTSNMYAFEKGV